MERERAREKNRKWGKKKMNQEIQLDWSKIEKPKFCEEYENRKLNILGIEKYWDDKVLTS